MKLRLERYFSYRWANDKLIAVKDMKDIDMLSQMPSEIQVQLFSNFLYRIFLSRFKSFFQFQKQAINNKTGKILKHAYYNWNNDKYKDFMI